MYIRIVLADQAEARLHDMQLPGVIASVGTPARSELRLHERDLVRDRPGPVFERLVLMANPRFLGMLRRVLPPRLGECVAAAVPKDLVHQGERAVRAHLPEDALR